MFVNINDCDEKLNSMLENYIYNTGFNVRSLWITKLEILGYFTRRVLVG